MAKLEMPSRAFIQDFVSRAFPQYDWSRGSAINDLVIKAVSTLMQPLRHEIDVTKVNGSVSNWQYMQAADLDELAANWGSFRQTGGLSIGTVRIYFSAAQDYQFNSLEFFSSDGTTFVLSAPVKIAAADLFTRRLSDGTFYFDVTVQSVGVGSRYAMPANSIVGVRNKPQGIVSVTNPSDFEVTAPDESNFDVVNKMFKNLGMKNLVSRQSIRAPILDNFPGVIDIFITGVGHPNMLRDLVTVQLPTGPVLMHLGGMTDVWLNTTSVSKQQVLISYVPSSLEVKLISADQAENSELIFSFTRGQYSVDGIFSNPDLASLDLDESTSVEFDIEGVSLPTTTLGIVSNDRAQLLVKDIVSGNDLIAVPGPAGFSPYLGDLSGINLENTDVQANDYLLLNNVVRKITNVTGRMIDVAPYLQSLQTYTYAGAALQPASRVIALPAIQTLARINDRLVLPSTAAAGEYTVLGLATNQVTIGKPVASGLVSSQGVNPQITNGQVFRFTGISGGRPLIPPGVGTTHYLYFGTDAGYDQTKYYQIAAVVEVDTTHTDVTVIDPAGTSPTQGSNVSIIQGLSGILPTGAIFTLQRDNGQLFAQDPVQAFTVGHTKYANVTAAVIAGGDNSFSSVGIGALVTAGDVIVFTGLNVPTAQIPQTGGDGSIVSVVVTGSTALDQVSFTPALPFDIPINTPFSVIRNSTQVAQATATAVDAPNSNFTIASMPLGLGDGLGLIVLDPAGNRYIVTAATAGNVRTLQFKAPVSVRTLTFSATGYVPPSGADVNKPVQQAAGTTSNGVLYSFDNATRTWLVIPNTSSDTFADTTGNNVSVIGGTGKGQLSTAASAAALTGYINAVSGDIGQLVRQGIYTGVLSSFDNTLYQWKVKPLSDADIFDSQTNLTYVDLGSGTPTSGHGQGLLQAAAGPVQIGTGAVTITLNPTPLFLAGDLIHFYSRLGRHAGMYNGTTFAVSQDTAINTAPFAGVTAGTHQLMILNGSNAGVFGISKVNAFSLALSGPLIPEYTELANAPSAQPIVNAVTLTVGTTTFAQPGIGLWGMPGRCVKIVGPGGTQLFPIASINNADSIQLENPGLPFAIFPNSGYTFEVVEALHTPFWIVPVTSLKAYRIFRTVQLGDLLLQGSQGGFSNVTPANFTDTSVNFFDILLDADFTTGDYKLFIDSGSQASVTPITITAAGPNTLVTDATFPLTETNVAYRIVHVNDGRDTENWIEATVVATSDPKKQLLLNVADGYDFSRFGSYTLFDITIVPHPSWTPPGGWSFGNNWTMAKFTAAYNPSTKTMTLDNATGHWTFTSGDMFNVGNGFQLPSGSKVRVSIRLQDRTSASQLDGMVLNTFNYYQDKFFTLPVVKISDVQVLDPTSLQPVRSIPYSIRVDDAGLRYSSKETNTLVIEDDTVALLPIAITYITDSSIDMVNNYLNQDDTRVVNGNQLAKRMETLSVSVTLSVRTTLTANAVASQIASFINSRRSTQTLSKADIIKDLYSTTAISYIDISSFVLSGTYYKSDGTIELSTDVNEVFGSETASYLSDNISVSTL